MRNLPTVSASDPAETSGLLAALEASQEWHSDAAASLIAASTPLLLSPFVLAEPDYLLATRVGGRLIRRNRTEPIDPSCPLAHHERSQSRWKHYVAWRDGQALNLISGTTTPVAIRLALKLSP